jgi:group I intron endonuclease
MRKKRKFDIWTYVPYNVKYQDKIIGIIYKATNLKNEKFYIGKTFQGLDKRKKDHLSSSKTGCGYLFHKAIRKYGEDNFIWTIILEKEISKNELGYMEMLYIDEMKPEYNLTKGGEGGSLINYTSKIRKNLGNGQRGKKLPLEHRIKIGLAGMGRKLNKKQQETLVKCNKERIWTKEMREKTGLKSKGRRWSEENRKKLADRHRGIPKIFEHKMKIKEAVSKPVARIVSGKIIEVYDSAKEAAKILKINVRRHIYQKRINLTTQSLYKYISKKEAKEFKKREGTSSLSD